MQSLPRFQRAGVHARSLRRISGLLGAVAIGLAALAWLFALFAGGTIWTPVLCNTAASLLLVAAALRSALVPARWRQRAVAAANEAVAGNDPSEAAGPPAARIRLLSAARDTFGRAAASVRSIGSESIEFGGLALIAVLSVREGWNLSLTPGPDGTAGSVVGGTLLAAAFGLLVLERGFAATEHAEWPEASPLAQITRAAVATLSTLALCLFASRTGSLWPTRAAVIVGLLPAAIGMELVVRAVLALFRSQHARHEPQMAGTSLLSELLRWPPPPLLTIMQEELRSRTSIDLRQVWAFGFLRSALIPVLACVLFAGWLLSGVNEVPMDGRGIYERFGRPVAVLKPGLHAGLPWPFGRVVPVENGSVHEIAATIAGSDSAGAPPVAAEGPAPASANRLWDVVHDTDRSQIIASREDGRQSFQLVDLDIRFFYRIGLSDGQALAATYNTADLAGLVRSVAGEELVRAFASQTLDNVLGERRTGLAAEIRSRLQARLDHARSGVEMLAVVIEAIHPPSGAANAYHAVQAAQIDADALVSQERGNAAKTTSAAEIVADAKTDDALAKARQTLARADVAWTRTKAEVEAYRKSGQAFLLERYFEELDKGMARSKALIIDDRLLSAAAPTIDLRDFALPVVPPVQDHGSPGSSGTRPAETRP